MRIIIGVVLILTASATAVSADWQYTRWGMTGAEVEKASNGAAIPHPDQKKQSSKKSIALLLAPYTASQFHFNVTILFNRKSRNLDQVNLELKDASRCPSLVGALRSRYGPTLKESRPGATHSIKWRDEEDKNFVWYLGIGPFSQGKPSYCDIMYSPLFGKKSGL